MRTNLFSQFVMGHLLFHLCPWLNFSEILFTSWQNVCFYTHLGPDFPGTWGPSLTPEGLSQTFWSALQLLLFLKTEESLMMPWHLSVGREWEKRRQARWRGNIAGQQAIPHDSAHCLTHFSCCAQSTAQTSPTLAALSGGQTEAHEKLNALTEVHHGARSKGHFHVPHQPALPTQPFDGSFALHFY